MIAPDFLCLWAPATDSIAVALVEGARAHRRKKDKQWRIEKFNNCKNQKLILPTF